MKVEFIVGLIILDWIFYKMSCYTSAVMYLIESPSLLIQNTDVISQSTPGSYFFSWFCSLGWVSKGNHQTSWIRNRSFLCVVMWCVVCIIKWRNRWYEQIYFEIDWHALQCMWVWQMHTNKVENLESGSWIVHLSIHYLNHLCWTGDLLVGSVICSSTCCPTKDNDTLIYSLFRFADQAAPWAWMYIFSHFIVTVITNTHIISLSLSIQTPQCLQNNAVSEGYINKQSLYFTATLQYSPSHSFSDCCLVILDLWLVAFLDCCSSI